MAALPPQVVGKIGKRGTIVIPARLRRRYDITEGSLVIAEPHEDGILVRPAVVLPVEVCTPVRRVELLLANAIDAPD